MKRWLAGMPLLRGGALFLALFTAVNVIHSLRAGVDENVWWVDARMLPGSLVILAAGAAGLFAMGMGRGGRMARGVVLLLAALALVNVAMFYWLAARGVIHPATWAPLSLPMAAGLALLGVLPGRAVGGEWWWRALGFVAAAALFPLAQMHFFGTTDYRRPADAIVVFGARTYADGTASQALADRVRTAVDLYQQGLAPVLIFSGGPGDGATSEPQAMRALALSLNVPDTAIVLDSGGVHTDASVADTTSLFGARGIRRALVVSHAYHLPRIRLAYDREIARAGMHTEILTVPAKESAPLTRMPVYMAREVVALHAYYLRGLL